MTSALPLSGLTVVAIEQAVAAPLATRHLADLGARVIKIERPDGGDFARSYDSSVNGLSSYFVWLNRTKESLTLDLKHPIGLVVMQKLLDRADVFVHNLAPGAADRLGVGSEKVRAIYPRLVACEISGYGHDGPYADRRAYDLLVQAEVGLISITGTEESPSKVGISVADIAAGMYAYSGILAALLQRASTGNGTVVRVSLFDALAEWMSAPLYYTAGTGSQPRRSGAMHATIAPYEPFVTSDGTTVFLAIQNNREWGRLCAEVLDQPDLTNDPRFRTNPLRIQHRDDLRSMISSVARRWSAEEFRGRLERAGIAYAEGNSVSTFLEHPQLQARRRWRRVDSPAGPLAMLRPPVDMDGIEPMSGAVPALGQHTDGILKELGFDPAELTALKEKGAI